MNIIGNYFEQAQLALAAYAELFSGMTDEAYSDALEDAGMSTVQAQAFASEWLVVDTLNDLISGTNATVFRNIETGENFLAIRGTEPTDIGDIVADYFIISGVPTELNPQYTALKDQVQIWLDSNVLDSSFTVAGHSLGGYLAAGLVADFPDNISQAYLYNAPGNNSITSQVLQALGVTNTPDATKITSLRADAGLSFIAALGIDISPPITITIENQFLTDVPNPPSAFNHSQRVLTDALAVYALFSELSPALNVEDITTLLKTDSYQNVMTLELAVEKLAQLFIPGANAIPSENRDAMYQTIYNLQNSTLFQQSTGLVNVEVLAGNSDIISLAQTDIAYRYALVELNSFAITGDSSLYAQHNTNGELDPYDTATGLGLIGADEQTSFNNIKTQRMAA